MTILLEREDADAAALATPFLRALVSLIRAQDTYGVWEGRDDKVILADFLLTKEQRRAIPIMGDPDPDTLHRLDLFHGALGLAIEKACGLIASPMMKMSHEGCGRVVLTVGRLVVVSRHLRDVHRFGFESLTRLAEAGDRLVQDAVRLIEAHPEAARL